MKKILLEQFIIIAGGVFIGYHSQKIMMQVGDPLLYWLIEQIREFNIVTFLAIVLFTTALSRQNTSKLLKEQSQELYNEIEELKDEIRGNTKRKG